MAIFVYYRFIAVLFIIVDGTKAIPEGTPAADTYFYIQVGLIALPLVWWAIDELIKLIRKLW